MNISVENLVSMVNEIIRIVMTSSSGEKSQNKRVKIKELK